MKYIQYVLTSKSFKTVRNTFLTKDQHKINPRVVLNFLDDHILNFFPCCDDLSNSDTVSNTLHLVSEIFNWHDCWGSILSIFRHVFSLPNSQNNQIFVYYMRRTNTFLFKALSHNYFTGCTFQRAILNLFLCYLCASWYMLFFLVFFSTSVSVGVIVGIDLSSVLQMFLLDVM